MNVVNRYVVFLTFIPWVIVFINSIINNFNSSIYKTCSWKHIKKHFFDLFRLDTLFLVVAFFYFASFNKEFVDKYLFAVMCIYMFLNRLHEGKIKVKKNFYKDNLISLIAVFILMMIPFLVYFIENNLILTYKIMLLYLFLEYIIIVVSKGVSKLFKKN